MTDHEDKGNEYVLRALEVSLDLGWHRVETEERCGEVGDVFMQRCVMPIKQLDLGL